MSGSVMTTAENETVTIRKGGQVVLFSMKRSTKGIHVSLKVDPSIEELFREWAKGRLIDASGPHANGKLWEGKEGPLSAYAAIGVEGYFQSAEGTYNLVRVGTNLHDDNGTNLGFLRLQGASSPEGIQFFVKGVYSSDAVREAGRKIKSALQHFYVNFVKPLDVVITMSSMEL